ncbi:hypothetical protein M427DRAFT_72596 [Gonapodya prolifera JEL478]|uniref:Uncharacterized protein n=1 Tax=Gonapodya prolifera (strain JEL478) TaxID=1344416 RepID=A0A139A4W0_GONPJ|nr:hypothetical protein M427DRAFT_72596 [Gonapodya prolifera JEL478]|eukprot:KXS11852.1 hypothetical protein M427DRAFT_72596 [Gonapodya prolifera JEL478]
MASARTVRVEYGDGVKTLCFSRDNAPKTMDDFVSAIAEGIPVLGAVLLANYSLSLCYREPGTGRRVWMQDDSDVVALFDSFVEGETLTVTTTLDEAVPINPYLLSPRTIKLHSSQSSLKAVDHSALPPLAPSAIANIASRHTSGETTPLTSSSTASTVAASIHTDGGDGDGDTVDMSSIYSSLEKLSAVASRDTPLVPWHAAHPPGVPQPIPSVGVARKTSTGAIPRRPSREPIRSTTWTSTTGPSIPKPHPTPIPNPSPTTTDMHVHVPNPVSAVRRTPPIEVSLFHERHERIPAHTHPHLGAGSTTPASPHHNHNHNHPLTSQPRLITPLTTVAPLPTDREWFLLLSSKRSGAWHDVVLDVSPEQVARVVEGWGLICGREVYKDVFAKEVFDALVGQSPVYATFFPHPDRLPALIVMEGLIHHASLLSSSSSSSSQGHKPGVSLPRSPNGYEQGYENGHGHQAVVAELIWLGAKHARWWGVEEGDLRAMEAAILHALSLHHLWTPHGARDLLAWRTVLCEMVSVMARGVYVASTAAAAGSDGHAGPGEVAEVKAAVDEARALGKGAAGAGAGAGGRKRCVVM